MFYCVGIGLTLVGSLGVLTACSWLSFVFITTHLPIHATLKESSLWPGGDSELYVGLLYDINTIHPDVINGLNSLCERNVTVYLNFIYKDGDVEKAKRKLSSCK